MLIDSNMEDMRPRMP